MKRIIQPMLKKTTGLESSHWICAINRGCKILIINDFFNFLKEKKKENVRGKNFCLERGKKYIDNFKKMKNKVSIQHRSL